MQERERCGQRGRQAAARHAATPSASQPVDFQAGLRACEGVPCTLPWRLPMRGRTVADAVVVFAYRCGGSAGMPRVRVTGFPFQPTAGLPGVT